MLFLLLNARKFQKYDKSRMKSAIIKQSNSCILIIFLHEMTGEFHHERKESNQP
jgi:hypothetical protein